MPELTEIASWIQDQRARSGLNQTELALHVGVSQGTISAWERGKGQPDAGQLATLQTVFGEVVPLVAEPEPAEGYEREAVFGWGEEYPLDAVFVRTDTRSVVDVVRRINAKRYDLNPEFQRMFLWDDKKQSRLIESCVMRIPLPVLYVAEAPDGKIVVVDGLQRLSTFQRFLNNELALKFERREDGTPHPLEGKLFRGLPQSLQERVEDTQLTLYILDSKAPERAKLDIFDRVNGGVPLTRQQMRNCLYNGRGTAWLAAAAASDLFIRATGAGLNQKTMRDREAINRFCGFTLLGWGTYPGDMDGFLAAALDKMNRMAGEELDSLREKFDRALQINFDLFGRHAFRKSLAGSDDGSRSVLNIALFDVCMVLLGRESEARVSSCAGELRGAVRRLLQDAEFIHAITYSTNSRVQVARRFEFMESELSEVLQ